MTANEYATTRPEGDGGSSANAEEMNDLRSRVARLEEWVRALSGRLHEAAMFDEIASVDMNGVGGRERSQQ